jgi:hypothetical protein
MTRLIFISLLGSLLVGCGREDEEAAALRREVETLREENALKKERVKALHEQLEIEAAEKVESLEKNEETLKELEAARAANAPLIEKMEEAERRVQEMEEMHKEVKKLE